MSVFWQELKYKIGMKKIVRNLILVGLSCNYLSIQVVVHVDETTPIRGVLLTLFGRMKIYWKTVDGGGTQEFCEIEDYLDEKV